MARQDWTYKQTVVVLRTYFDVPFNKANNSNSKIIEIARIIGRSVNSVKMKIGNFGSLDPELKKVGIVGLDGATKMDKEVWHELSSDKEKLALESASFLSEFLNEPLEKIIAAPTDNIPIGEDKQSLVKVRVNQYFFRTSVLGIYDSTCCITGINVPQLLVASHIKPWSVDKRNRLNPQNGLCLNSMHDRAFDAGLITITPDYIVKLSKSISDNQNEVWTTFFKQYAGKTIKMPERNFPNKEFLEYHNKKVFIK